MKRILTLFIIFLSIFIFGCTTEKKQNNTIPQSNIHTPSTLVVDPYSTSKFESLNFGDSLEKIKTLPTLIYYDELVEPTATFVGTALGVPAQLNKLFFNGYDILFNGMDPEVGDIFRRRPKKER